MGGQLKLAKIDDTQLKEAAAAATIPASLSAWLYGIHYDEVAFDQELARTAAHMEQRMYAAR